MSRRLLTIASVTATLVLGSMLQAASAGTGWYLMRPPVLPAEQGGGWYVAY